ncbi:hypothetical protein GCM10018793_48680 [Streptomyces sulfonofaciens]|uniref:Uncharacterized protein n=1 Tax=Streptomyces sulfonofaciens TaxID=68272 RepID=A0A919GI36_9ACTN|nr:hypothetical protein GCM10018793_48680 [Streptomyces sulfonofaciens]
MAPASIPAIIAVPLLASGRDPVVVHPVASYEELLRDCGGRRRIRRGKRVNVAFRCGSGDMTINAGPGGTGAHSGRVRCMAVTTPHHAASRDEAACHADGGEFECWRVWGR